MQKKCKECGIIKPLSEFYGVQGECKECTKKRVNSNPKNFSNKVANCYDHTEKGVIRVIYKTQKANSKRRGHNTPEYTKEELKEWLYKHDFKKLYKVWVKSGYKKNLKPSIDRKNDFKGYSFSNIKLGTWKENMKHQVNDIANGIGTSGKRCKPVLCYDKKHRLIAEYVSYNGARRLVGYCMWKSLKTGKPDKKNGYYWRYKYDN